MTYEKIKKGFYEHKDKIVLGVCFVLVFIVGFGTGKFTQSTSGPSKTQANYTTNTNKKPFFQAPQVAVETPAQPQVAGTSTPAAPCVIKGNISSAGKKVYHVQCGAFYKRVKPEQCFATAGEAEAAGFVKSLR